MRISLEGKLGILLALIFGFGAGAIIVFPDKVWIGWALMGISALGSVVLGIHHFYELFNNREDSRRKRRMIAFIGMVICGVSFLGFSTAYYWPSEKAETAEKSALSPNVQIGSLGKLRYLPSYADYMSVALRQIENKITDSVRDSTSFLAIFSNFSNMRYTTINDAASDHAQVEQMIKELVKADSFYSSEQFSILGIINKDSSYSNDLLQFSGPDYMGGEFCDLIMQVTKFLRYAAEKEGKLDPSAVDIIQDYGRKTSTEYQKDYQARVVTIQAIKAKISDLNRP
jgi:hypothetical protein